MSEWPRLPDGVRLAADIDLQADDPALLDTGKRRCVAERKAGGRCGSFALPPGLLCAVHSGVADPAAGGRAKAANRRLALVQAQERVAERSLGVRAALSAQLQERQDDLRQILDALITDAKAGNMKAAALLLPYLDQALGKPMPVEVKTGSLAGELSAMSEAELAEIVKRGREARRLKAV